MHPNKTTFRKRLRLLWGVQRRLLLNVCRPGYVRSSVAQRHGECRRCGTCCRLVLRCRYYREEDGVASCVLYNRFRPLNCVSFPIDHRDLADRDIIAPHIPCGYRWLNGTNGKQRVKK
ncbi:MAG: hypothetical protein M1457_14110 [bacterium]|nr:hypothetical protein [bacterium]